MPYSMQQTQTQQPKAAQRQQHAASKNTYSRDSVLSNEKDEPKMTKARCILRRRCRYLQCVRDGEGGAAVAAPIKPETKTRNQNQNQTKAHETCPTQCNKRKSQQPKAMQPQQHDVSKTTYSRDSKLSNEKDEPKMTKARCNLRRRCRYLQCVRDGEGGAAAAAPIKPETKTKTKTKIKQKRMKYALLNATNAKLSSRKQCNHNNTLYPKTLTVEIQFFQMRKMNQR